MRKWKSLFEIVLFPLEVLAIGFVILGIGDFILNENFAIFYTIKNPYILLIAKLFIEIGKFVISNFPVILVINLVNRRKNAGATITMGILGYIAFLITTMVFADITLPTTLFSSTLGINYVSYNTASSISVVHYPLQTGLIGALIVGICTHLAFFRTRNKQQYGFFSFINKNNSGVIHTIFYCIIAGFFVSLLYPMLNMGLNRVIVFIASDITNPVNLFVYGVFDRLLSIFYMGDAIRYPFWFTSLGGSWNNITGESIVGDVNIFTTISNASIAVYDYGRFITPYYVLNIFAIPGYLIAMYTLYSDVIMRRKLLLLLLILIFISVMTGNLLVVELFMLFASPLLLVFHIFYTGLLFGILEYFKARLGFIYAGSTVTALPGKLIDYLIYLRNPDVYSTLVVIAIVGIISFFVYFFITKLYYGYMAYDLFDLGKKKKIVIDFADAVGGLDNIKNMNSSPYRLTIQFINNDLIDLDKLQKIGATRVTNTRAGLNLSFGASSIIIKKLLNREINSKKRVID